MTEALIVRFDERLAPEIRRIRNNVFSEEQGIDETIDFDGHSVSFREERRVSKGIGRHRTFLEPSVPYIGYGGQEGARNRGGARRLGAAPGIQLGRGRASPGPYL